MSGRAENRDGGVTTVRLRIAAGGVVAIDRSTVVVSQTVELPAR